MDRNIISEESVTHEKHRLMCAVLCCNYS